MRMIVKSGSEQITSSHVADDRTLIINLRERWPVKVLFSKRLNELLINVRHDSEPIRIRMSHPIEVTNKEICKDQVLIVYKKLELAIKGAPAQKSPNTTNAQSEHAKDHEMKKRNETVFVSGVNASGESDFYEATVSVTEDEYELAEHHELAREQARENGFESPLLCFDRGDFGNILAVVDRVKAANTKANVPEPRSSEQSSGLSM